MTKKDKTIKFFEKMLTNLEVSREYPVPKEEYSECELCRIHGKFEEEEEIIGGWYCWGCPLAHASGLPGCVDLSVDITNKSIDELILILNMFIEHLKKLPPKRFTKQGWEPFDFSFYLETF